MDENGIGPRDYTGETCTTCDRELVLVVGSAAGEVYIECDCGSATCIGSPGSAIVSPAA